MKWNWGCDQTDPCCIPFDEAIKFEKEHPETVNMNTILITVEEYNGMRETIERQRGQIEILKEIVFERLGCK